MDWILLFGYLKFIAGVLIMVYGYLTAKKIGDILIIIGSLTILSTGVTFRFEPLFKFKP